MKILHTADWHLGKRLEQFSRLEEQQAVMDELIQLADNENVDAVIIAGDLFDTYNPPTEAVELFYKSLKKLAKDGARPVIAIAGNHDSPDRIEAPDPLARECGIIFAGYPQSVVQPFKLDTGLEVTQSEPGFVELKLPSLSTPLRIILTPYANENRLKTFLGTEDEESTMRDLISRHWQQLAQKYCDSNGINLLTTHLFMVNRDGERPEEPDEEKPILHIGGAQEIYTESIPDSIQYTALGHLHRYQVISETPCPVVYSSSPLAYSFSEAGQSKYAVIVEAEPGKPATYHKHPLEKGKPLARKKFHSVEEALQWLTDNPDALVEMVLSTESYLTADQRKSLYQNHDGIVTIIPEVQFQNEDDQSKSRIDLQQDVEQLFIQFFRHQKGQEPNEELVELFREIRGEHN